MKGKKTRRSRRIADQARREILRIIRRAKNEERPEEVKRLAKAIKREGYRAIEHPTTGRRTSKRWEDCS